MKNWSIVGICLLLITLGRFLLTDAAFSEFFYIDQYLEQSRLLKILGLDDMIFLTIDPFEKSEDYYARKDAVMPLKRSISYYLFTSITIIRVLSIVTIIYFLCLIIGYASFINPNKQGLFESIAGSMRSIPAIGWLPLFSLLGIILSDFGMALFLASGVLPLVASQIFLGIRKCPIELIQTSELHGLTKRFIYFQVLRKASESVFLQGLRYGYSLGLVLLLVYEILFESTPGLMRVINPLSVGVATQDKIMVILIIGLIGLSMDRITPLIEKTRYNSRTKRAKTITSIFAPQMK